MRYFLWALVLSFLLRLNLFGADRRERSFDGAEGSEDVVEFSRGHNVGESTQEGSQPTKGAALSNRVLLVLFSGFASCKNVDPMTTLKAHLTDEFRKRFPGRELDIVEYCYERQSRRSLRVRLPGETAFADETQSPREALLSLSERAKKYKHIGLIGHSWGGWTALRAVEGWEQPKLENPNKKAGAGFEKGLHEGWGDGARDALAKRPRRKLNTEGIDEDSYDAGFASGYEEGYEDALKHQSEPKVPALDVSVLVTIDPISVPGCNPVTVITGCPECLSFPPDIDHEAIRRRTGKWVNFYQKNGKLHSGAPTAEEMQEQLVDSTHEGIKNDPRVLSETASAVLSAFGP